MSFDKIIGQITPPIPILIKAYDHVDYRKVGNIGKGIAEGPHDAMAKTKCCDCVIEATTRQIRCL